MATQSDPVKIDKVDIKVLYNIAHMAIVWRERDSDKLLNRTTCAIWEAMISHLHKTRLCKSTK